MRVKELLKKKGMTAKELAARLGMTETGLSIAISEKGNPPLKRLEDIAAALGVEVVELFSPNTGDFTALIDHKGDLYRCNTIAQTRELLDRIEAGGDGAQ